MIFNKKVKGSLEASKPLVTDGVTYLLHFNITKKEDTNSYGYDEISLTKNEFEYYDSIKEISDEFICKLIRRLNG